MMCAFMTISTTQDGQRHLYMRLGDLHILVARYC